MVRQSASSDRVRELVRQLAAEVVRSGVGQVQTIRWLRGALLERAYATAGTKLGAAKLLGVAGRTFQVAMKRLGTL